MPTIEQFEQMQQWPYGWGGVLDYIGVGWRDEAFDMKNSQISFADLEE